MKDVACLHVVYTSQQMTSRPTTRSTQNTTVRAQKHNLAPLLVGQYVKSTNTSTWPYHQAYEGKCRLDAESVRSFGALGSLQSKKMLDEEKTQETHIASNKEIEKWIENYVDTETAVARKQVKDAETAIKQEPEDMRNDEKVGLITRQPKKSSEDMLYCIGDSLSNHATSDAEENGDDEDDDGEDTELGKLSKDDEPGWVMGTIFTMVQQRMENFWQTLMKLDTLMQLWWGDKADCVCHGDQKYGMAKFQVLAVVKPQME